MTKDGTDRVLILIWLSALFFLFLFLFLLPAYCFLPSPPCFPFQILNLKYTCSDWFLSSFCWPLEIYRRKG